MDSKDDVGLREFLCEYPAEAVVFTICPLVVAGALVGNAFVHGLSLVAPGAFALALVAYSVLVTRHHLAAARLTRIESGLAGVESNAD